MSWRSWMFTARLFGKRDLKAEKRVRNFRASRPFQKPRGLKMRDLRILEAKRRMYLEDKVNFPLVLKVPRRELCNFPEIDDLWTFNTSSFQWGMESEDDQLSPEMAQHERYMRRLLLAGLGEKYQ